MSPAQRRQAVERVQRKKDVSQRRACQVHWSVPRSTQRYRKRRISERGEAVGCTDCTNVGEEVSAVRLSDDRRQASTGRLANKPQADVSPLATGRLQSAEKDAEKATFGPQRQQLRASSRGAQGPRLDVGFHSRPHAPTGRAAEVARDHRRVHAGMLGLGGGSEHHGRSVLDVLTNLFLTRGVPKHIRSDNGPEFIAQAIRRHAKRRWLGDALHRAGQPMGERLCGVVLQPPARRVTELRGVRESGRGSLVRPATPGGAQRRSVRTAAWTTRPPRSSRPAVLLRTSAPAHASLQQQHSREVQKHFPFNPIRTLITPGTENGGTPPQRQSKLPSNLQRRDFSLSITSYLFTTDVGWYPTAVDFTYARNCILPSYSGVSDRREQGLAPFGGRKPLVWGVRQVVACRRECPILIFYCRKIRLDFGRTAAFSAMLRSFSGKSGMAMRGLSFEGIFSGTS